MTISEPEFSRTLDVGAAANVFQARGRVQVPQVLEAASADALHDCLLKQVPWRLAYNEGERAVVLYPSELQQLGPEGRRRLMESVIERARDRFQYVYHCYPILAAYLKGEDPGLLLHRFLEWLVRPETLDVARRITGIPTLIKADAQATLYMPGQFLTLHDDTGAEVEKRRVGYVLNLCREWHADWGGLLQFIGEEGDVTETWVPRYNVLNLFRVPVRHAVSCVTRFAAQPRLAITGWFRDA